MDNKVFDSQVHRLIHDGVANTSGSIASSMSADDSQIDNSLRRLKKSDLIAFDKPAKRWTSKAQPSAPADEGVVGSEGNPTSASAPATQGSNMTDKDHSTVADIDDAINQARSKKGQKPPKAEGAKRPRLSDDERKARDEQREKDKAARKAEREQAKAEKLAQRDKDRPAAHMSKVAKAAAKLPSLQGVAQQIFNDCTANLTVSDITALAAHLQHFNRTKATERALQQKVGTGDVVRIVGGDSRFVGMSGTVDKAQRIRCYVKVEGAKKPVYLFTSDVEVTKPAPKQAAAS